MAAFSLTSDSGSARTQRGRALLALREIILRGQFPTGKRLEEIELGRRLGVSRHILRAVLERLAAEGLLEPVASGGYAARHFTMEDVRDAILARASLEGLAASLAAKRIRDPAELEPARKLNAELAGAVASGTPDPPSPEEMARFGDLNAAFHDAVVAMARSPMLAWALERVQAVGFASPAAVVIPAESDGVSRAFEEHEAILNAIQSGDSAQAEALVKQHAYLAIRGIESAVEGWPHAGRNIALALVGNQASKPAARTRKRVGKTRESAGGSTSERILDAAAELFCDKGFCAATTRELAARLRIQQASLYHHMRNKEDLLNRICRQVMDSFLAELPAALKKARSGRHRIDAFIDAHLRTMTQNPHRTLAMVTEFRALSGPHFAEISERYQQYSGLLQAELESAQKSGSLRTDLSASQIRLALLNILSWTPRWFHPSGTLSRNDLSSIYARVFWEGVMVNPGQREVPLRLLPPSAGRPRPRDSHQGTLGKFIRGAAELFARQGYESTTTRSLATLLGMEKATLYYHVEGKEDLLYAICKSSIEQLAADVNQAIEGIPDPLEQLQVWIQAHMVSLLRDQTQHATSLAEARALSPERLAEIVSLRKAYQVRIRALIEAGQKAGRLRDDAGSKYLGLMLEGLLDRTVVWYRRSGELSPAALGAKLCQLFMTGAQRRSRQ